MQDITVPLKSEPDENLLPLAHPQPQHHQNYQVMYQKLVLFSVKIEKFLTYILARAKCGDISGVNHSKSVNAATAPVDQSPISKFATIGKFSTQFFKRNSPLRNKMVQSKCLNVLKTY